jgi:hypothetical protein
MKCTRMLGLAAMATLVLTAFAGSASATVLCKTKTNPCGEDFPAKTLIKAEADPTISTASFLESESGFSMECPIQKLNATTTGTGGSTQTVVADIETLTFTNCLETMHIPTLGSLEIHYTSNGNGTVTVGGLTIEYVNTTLFYTCRYQLPAGTHFGTLVGGAKATIAVSAPMSLKEGSGLCGTKTRWTASFVVSSPAPLYVAGS